MVLLIVMRWEIIGRLRHKSLFLSVSSVFHSTGRAICSAAAIAEPQEHDDLANQHADGTGDQTSQDTQDSGNNDEADNAGDGPLPAAVVHVVVRTVWRTTVAPEGWPLPIGKIFRRVTLHQMRLAMAALGDAESRSHAHHPSLGTRDQNPETGKQEHSQALGLATALPPRETVRAGLLDLSSGNVQPSLAGIDDSHGHRLQRDGVAREIENSEADRKQLRAWVVLGSNNRHDLESRAKAYGVSLQAIRLSSQNGLNAQWMGRWRHYLAVVHQEAAIISGKVQGLWEVSTLKVQDSQALSPGDVGYSGVRGGGGVRQTKEVSKPSVQLIFPLAPTSGKGHSVHARRTSWV